MESEASLPSSISARGPRWRSLSAPNQPAGKSTARTDDPIDRAWNLIVYPIVIAELRVGKRDVQV
jgi:hypothetical protein